MVWVGLGQFGLVWAGFGLVFNRFWLDFGLVWVGLGSLLGRFACVLVSFGSVWASLGRLGSVLIW